ncbi:hypothetical protein ACFY2J_38700 [Streptomyces collinus]
MTQRRPSTSRPLTVIRPDESARPCTRPTEDLAARPFTTSAARP